MEDVGLEKFVRVYHKSEVIFEENSTGSEMYVVCSGRVKLYKQHGAGHHTVLAVLKAGEHFGEMALIDGSPRSATAVALQDNTKLVALDKAKFLYLVQQLPEFAFTVLETLSRRIRDVNARLAEATAKEQGYRKAGREKG